MAEERKVIFKLEADESDFVGVIADLSKAGDEGKKAAEKIKQAFKITGKEIATKNGLDEFSASLEKTGRSTTTLTGQLRNIRKELAALELSGKTNTKQFADLSKQAGRLQDAIGDVAARTRVLASDTRKLDAVASAVTGLAGAYAAVQGATALFGKENEELQKQLLRVQSALAVVNGLQAAFATLNKDSAAAITANAIATKAATAVMRAFGVSVSTTAASFKVLKAAIITTGIGALAVGVGLLIENFDKLTSLFSDSKKGLDPKVFNELFDKYAKDLGRSNEQLERQLKNNKLLSDLEKKRLQSALETEVAFLQLRGESEEKIIEARKKTREAIAAIDKQQLQDELNTREQQFQFISALEQRLVKSGIRLNEEQQNQINDYKNNLIDRQRELAVAIEELNLEVSTSTQLGQLQVRKILSQEIDATNKLIQQRARELGQAVFKELFEQAQREQQLRRVNAETIRSIIQTQLQQTIEDATASERERISARKKLLEQETADYISQLQIQQAERIAAGESEVAVNADINERIKLARLRLQNDLTAIDEAAELRRRQIRQETVRAAADAFSEASAFFTAQSAAQIQNLENQKQFELEAAGDNAEKRQQIEERFAQKRAEIQRKAAIAEKLAASFSAAVNGAAAIVKAFATSPLLAAFVAAAVAAQIGAIAAAPIPQFEKGGTVKGKRHSQGGTIIEAEEGEEIISRRPAMKYRKVLKEINKDNFERYVFKNYIQPVIERSHNSQPIVNVNAKLETADLRTELYKTRKQSERTNRTLLRMASNYSNPRSQW
jgi:hypothetical protein